MFVPVKVDPLGTFLVNCCMEFEIPCVGCYNTFVLLLFQHRALLDCIFVSEEHPL